MCHKTQSNQSKPSLPSPIYFPVNYTNNIKFRAAIFAESSYCAIVSKVKLASVVEGDPKAPFSIATTPRCRGGRNSFPGLLHFTLDPYLIILSGKQGGIKYHF